MENVEKTSVFGNSLIWFGAAVSIAEILTGALFAPLGFGQALATIVIGHAIGCVLLYFAGLIGAKHACSAMETTKLTYGKHGGLLFAGLNVIQLIGWTAVMIAAGAVSAQTVYPFALPWLWSVIIGALILVWIFAGVKNLQKINIAAMILLFLLSLVLSRLVFRSAEAPVIQEAEGLSWGAALELSIAMPLSWLPLIADYTCNARRSKLTCAVSASVYFVVSCWMYVIGMAAALYAGESDIAAIMKQAGLGISAMLIVIFSTVTTTFLDVYSSGVSMQSIWRKLPVKLSAAVVCVLGTLLAIFCDTSAFESFLYWIGSVFVPMIAIQIVDVFVMKNGQCQAKNYVPGNLAVWLVGFLLYRVFLKLDPICGSTLPVMAITAVLDWAVLKLLGTKEK